MADETTLRIALRGRVLADAAPAHEVEDGIFVSLEHPPPTRSVVEVHDGSAVRTLQVVRVLESGTGPGGRGFVGRYLDEPQTHKVGTEHLSGVSADVVAQLAHSDSGPEDSASAYPVPAPVLEPEPSEAIDLREHEAALAASESVEAKSGEAESGAAGEPAGSPESEKPEGQKPRGKKRKGRRRD